MNDGIEGGPHPIQRQNSNISNSASAANTQKLIILIVLIVGFILVLIIAFLMFSIFPNIVNLQEKYGVNLNTNINIILFLFIVSVLSYLIEVIIGFFLRKKIKEEGFLKNNTYLLFCIGFSIFQVILLVGFIAAIIAPSYTVVSQF